MSPDITRLSSASYSEARSFAKRSNRSRKRRSSARLASCASVGRGRSPGSSVVCGSGADADCGSGADCGSLTDFSGADCGSLTLWLAHSGRDGWLPQRRLPRRLERPHELDRLSAAGGLGWGRWLDGGRRSDRGGRLDRAGSPNRSRRLDRLVHQPSARLHGGSRRASGCLRLGVCGGQLAAPADRCQLPLELSQLALQLRKGARHVTRLLRGGIAGRAWSIGERIGHQHPGRVATPSYSGRTGGRTSPGPHIASQGLSLGRWNDDASRGFVPASTWAHHASALRPRLVDPRPPQPTALSG